MAESDQNLHFLDYWRVISSRKEIVIAVSLLVVLTGIIVTYSLPKVYMASSVIRVQESRSDVSVFGSDMMRFDPLFLRTQFEIIQSRPVIEEVIRRRELDRKLSVAYGYDQLPPAMRMDQTVKMMSKWMRVQQYRDTNLIEIQVLLAEPKGEAGHEAALAATMVAEVFREQVQSRSQKSTENALDALYDAFQEQERRLQLAEQEVERIRREEKIDVWILWRAVVHRLIR